MNIFYFDVDDDGHYFTDEIGHELKDAVAAKAVALAMLPGLTTPFVDGQNANEIVVRVRDHNGDWVLTARLCVTVEMHQ